MVERIRVSRPFSESSRSKFIKRDKEGVASVIGTIMALLVFLTFITLFTNTYIPIWMKENEKNHMDEVLNQFGEMKGKVDSLVVNAQVTGKPTINMYQPITLGSDGVPVFATATSGYIFLKPGGSVYDSWVNQSFYYKLEGGSPIEFDERGGGCVEFYGPNRYYVQQWYAYENGALMIFQEDGMAMRAAPSLVFIPNTDGSFSVQFDQVDLIGKNSTVGGLGSAGVTIDLIYHDSQTYDLCTASGADRGSLSITFVTRYNTTWMDYINTTAEDAGMTYGVSNVGDYTLTCTEIYDQYRPIYEITLTINDVDQFTHNRGYVTMELEY
ncbi:MAG: hypothetical protein MIO90_02665 [Methanomassiliicoccales archaeon]|nr:hypothetical protein [Methanomassiliicoccales archaeon]